MSTFKEFLNEDNRLNELFGLGLDAKSLMKVEPIAKLLKDLDKKDIELVAEWLVKNDYSKKDLSDDKKLPIIISTIVYYVEKLIQDDRPKGGNISLQKTFALAMAGLMGAGAVKGAYDAMKTGKTVKTFDDFE